MEDLQPIDEAEIGILKQEAQEAIKTRGINLGEFILVPVHYENQIEHMWFRVVEMIELNNKEQRVQGILCNEPQVVKGIRMGDPRWIDMEDIVSIGRWV